MMGESFWLALAAAILFSRHVAAAPTRSLRRDWTLGRYVSWPSFRWGVASEERRRKEEKVSAGQAGQTRHPISARALLLWIYNTLPGFLPTYGRPAGRLYMCARVRLYNVVKDYTAHSLTLSYFLAGHDKRIKSASSRDERQQLTQRRHWRPKPVPGRRTRKAPKTLEESTTFCFCFFFGF